MAMVPSYVVSALLQRFRSDPAVFARELPGSWLVWEPGPWRPSTTSKKTMVLTSVGSPHSGAGESLAMHLGTPPAGTKLALGRADGSQLYVNDATLSQAHLVLESLGGHRWSVADVGSLNGTWVDAVKLASHKPQPLKSNAQIQAGQVYLTFLEPLAMEMRLRLNG